MVEPPAKRRRLALWALAAACVLAGASPVLDPADHLVGRAEPLASALSIGPSPTAGPDGLGRRSVPLNSNGQPTAGPDGLERRAVPLNSNGQPSYPATWLNINDMTTLGALSNVAVVRMQTWRGSNAQYEWTPWWQYPVVGIAYLDLDVALGNQANRQLVTTMLDENDFGVSYMIDAYIDDQLWWGLFALKAYQVYGASSTTGANWLNAAVTIAANSSAYVNSECGGGPIWLTTQPDTKNTITTALWITFTARMYRQTGQRQYFNAAVSSLNWWLGWAFEPSTGKVYDTITYPACQPSGLQIYTYNSGVILSGLVDLYYATGNTTLLDLASTIAFAGIRDYTIPSSGILREACENDPQVGNKPPGCGQDQVVFKGIFVQGLADLYLARPDESIYNFLNTQLLSNAYDNLDSSWLFGQWWYGPWNITTAGPKTQICSLGAVAAAARVNALRNTLTGPSGAVATATVLYTTVPLPTTNGVVTANGTQPLIRLGSAVSALPAGVLASLSFFTLAVAGALWTL